MAGNLNVPEALIKSFFNEGVVCFVGSGPSINAGLASWDDLLKSMRDEAELTKTEYEFVNSHIVKQNYLITADFLREKMTDNQFAELMEREFSNEKPGKIHKAIVSLPLHGIITTNYDLLLYEADSDRRFKPPFTWQDTSIHLKIRSRFILHAHGIVNNYKSIILTASDYDKIRLSREASLFWDALRNIFEQHRILFIGYGLNDLDFNLFLRELRYHLKGYLRDQFALIEQNEKKRDPLKTHHLRRTGIRPIYIQEGRTLGEATLKWLIKLKKQIANRKNYEIQPVIRNDFKNGDVKVPIHQIAPLIRPLTIYLSNT